MIREGASQRRVLAAAIVLAVVAFVDPVAGAAEDPAPSAEASEPAFVPISQISTEAAAVATQLDRIRADLDAAKVEKSALQALPANQEELATYQAELEKAQSGRQSGGDLESLDTRWRALAGRLEAERAELGARANHLEGLEADLKQRGERWRLTRDNARKSAAPASVVAQVKVTLDSLASVDRELQTSRNEAVELESQVGKLAAAATSAIEGIAKARAELRARTFERTAPPLWDAGESASALPEEIVEAGHIVSRAARGAVNYARRSPERMLTHLLLVLVVLWAIRRARSVLERPGPPARAAPAALRYPLAAALVFAASLIGFIHPESPLGFRYLLGVSVLPFWVRVVLGVLPGVFAAPVYGFVALVVLTVVVLLVGDAPLLSHLLELSIFGAGLAGSLWLRRPARLAELPPELSDSGWSKLLSVWLHIAIAGFAIGLLASFFGYGNLAALVSNLIVVGTLIGSVFLLAVRIAEALVEALVVRGTLDRLRMIHAHPETFLRVIRRGLRTFGVVAWIQRTLISTGLWDPLAAAARSMLGTEVGYGAVSIRLGGMIAFVLTLWLSWLLARLITYTLDEEIFPRVRFAHGVPFALTTFSRYGILVLGFIAAIGVLGVPLDRLTIVISALGVGIGFGLQNIVNNFVSGVILLFERPIRVGDLIELEGLFGHVSSIGIRASKVRTFDGSDVIVPNGDLISARVTNWTLADKKRRIDFPVGVAYGTDPARVLEILLQVAKEHPEVLEDPEPEALFRSFGDSSLDFALRCWTESDRGLLPVQSDLAVAINAALAEAGIEIPFPQRDLHLRSVDPAIRSARPAREGEQG